MLIVAFIHCTSAYFFKYVWRILVYTYNGCYGSPRNRFFLLFFSAKQLELNII
ncbi:unnamed protein product [Tenebrio molitor]|nr:unnamed protein product [Tenebrio molitor]